MQRRTVLARATAVAPLAGVALAGCTGDGGGSGQGSADCPTPSTSNVTTLLPEGGDAFERSDTASFENTTADTGGTKTYVLAEYDTDEGTHWMTIARFPSAEDATREMDAHIEQESPGYGGVAYLQAGRYLYGAGGESRSMAEQLLAAAEPLSADCVSANAEWQ